MAAVLSKLVERLMKEQLIMMNPGHSVVYSKTELVSRSSSSTSSTSRGTRVVVLVAVPVVVLVPGSRYSIVKTT